MRTNLRSHPTAPIQTPNDRAGMTIIEVIVAITLLTGALLAMGAFMARFAQVTGTTTVRAEANELVADRLEEVKGSMKYATIDTYAKSEASIPNHPGFARQTLVTHTGGVAPSLYDYKTVTVLVTTPTLRTPAKKSTVISVF